MKKRRDFLEDSAHACAVAVAAGATGLANPSTAEAAEGQKYLLVGLVGSENPTRANFPFVNRGTRPATPGKIHRRRIDDGDAKR
jgi:hypothetical protein